jgi:hypothetical protein
MLEGAETGFEPKAIHSEKSYSQHVVTDVSHFLTSSNIHQSLNHSEIN